MTSPDTGRPPVPEISTAPPGGPRRWWSRVPHHLGRARTSTVVLVVLFVAVFTLYQYVRPEGDGAGIVTTGEDTPAEQSAPAEPAPSADPTAEPTETAEPTPTPTEPGGTTPAPTDTTAPEDTGPGGGTGSTEPTTPEDTAPGTPESAPAPTPTGAPAG